MPGACYSGKDRSILISMIAKSMPLKLCKGKVTRIRGTLAYLAAGVYRDREQ